MSIVAGFSTNPRENCIQYEEQKLCLKEVNEIVDELVNIVRMVKIPQPSDNNMSTPVFKSKSKNDKIIGTLTDIQENLQVTGNLIIKYFKIYFITKSLWPIV